MKEGNVDMRNYFKQRWKLLVDKGKVHDDNKEDDVISATNGIANPDMHEFNDCVNQIELEDMCSTGLNFTKQRVFTKSKQGYFSGTLKTLDSLMINECFQRKFSNAHVVFTPYLISDHTHVFMFIPRVTRSNQQRNRVDSVYDETGNRYEGMDVVEQFVKHFQGFLGQSFPVTNIKDMNSLVVKKVAEDDALYMIREVTNKEVKDAMFDIGDNKAPGPNGYTALFFKKAWPIISNDVMMRGLQIPSLCSVV
ncbi:hypothetical protein Tco_0270250 [Tanacetum coccineum]